MTRYLEYKIFILLYEKYGSRVALSMEMFDRDVQPVMNEYLQGFIREKNFKKDSRSWSNYRDYRPMVEFAKEEVGKGKPIHEAALEGARLRLRPILMTSFAFILGCLPLWFATGAGSVAREVMGTTVVGGMLAASLIGIFLVPSIFVMVEEFGAKKK